MPETAIITKENKEKVEKLKYKDYEDYIEDIYQKNRLQVNKRKCNFK